MLVARVIPGGLARGEVEIVDVPRHILTVREEKVGRGEGGHFSTSEKPQEREGEMMGGRAGEERMCCHVKLNASPHELLSI